MVFSFSGEIDENVLLAAAEGRHQVRAKLFHNNNNKIIVNCNNQYSVFSGQQQDNVNCNNASSLEKG